MRWKEILIRCVGVAGACTLLLYGLLATLPVYPPTYLTRLAWWLGEWFVRLIPPGEPGDNLNTSYLGGWARQLAFLGVFVGAFAITILLTWERRVSSRRTKISLIIGLTALLPFSAINWAYEDRLMRIEAQALIDLIMIVLGATLFLQLARVRPVTDLGKVLQVMAGTILLLEACLLPAFYAFSYLLWRQGIRGGALSEKWVTIPASVVSVAVSWLTYRRGSPTHQPSQDKKIVVG